MFVNVCAVDRSAVIVVLMLNELPVSVNPFPATNVPAPENCENVMFVSPRVTVLFVQTKPLSAFEVPASTNVKAEGNSEPAFMSADLVGEPDAATT